MKFVLFLPTKEEVLLLLPTAKCTKIQNSIVTWIFEGFFLFFLNCCSTLSLNHLALNVSKWRQIRFRESEQSGAGGELDRMEFRGRTFADNHFPAVELLACRSGSCLSTSWASAKGELKALYWRFQQEYETKASQKCSFLFAANVRVFGGFPPWCSLTWEKPRAPSRSSKWRTARSI